MASKNLSRTAGVRRRPIRLVFSDDRGTIRDHPDLLAVGMGGGSPTPLADTPCIRLPRGSDLFMLPGRTPLGWDPNRRRIVAFGRDEDGRTIHAVAAFLAPAHTAGLLAAYAPRPQAPLLPLYSYAAVGFAGEGYWTAACRVDSDTRQDPWRFDVSKLAREVEQWAGTFSHNRLVQQLRRCALEYHCRAAQNLFLQRHEAPLPVSVVCNARCLGCISLQPDDSFRAAHERLSQAPSSADVAEVALAHIHRVDRAVVSFGQGCEGEPLLMGDLLRDSVRKIRAATSAGTINLNTNGSLPDRVAELADLGLDSLRISLNSARPELYAIYFRPRGYAFDAVIRAMREMSGRGRFVSLNLFYFPGVTDRPEEIAALEALIPHAGVRMIQMRNLNIDPGVYRDALPAGVLGPGIGLDAFMRGLSERFPYLRFGYFNPPKEAYQTWESPPVA